MSIYFYSGNLRGNITKLQKQYHGSFTYGLLHRLEALEAGHYRIISIKRLNRDGAALVTTKFGKHTRKFKFDFDGEKNYKKEKIAM